MTEMIETDTMTLTFKLPKTLYNKLHRIAEEYTEVDDPRRADPEALVLHYLGRMIEDEVNDPEIIDPDLPDPVESFGEGWAQAMRGEGRPAREVLREMEEDTSS